MPTLQAPFCRPRVAFAWFAVLAALSACADSSTSFEPPATLTLSADLVPTAGTRFFNRGPSEFNPKYGGSTVRDWLVLDPDGQASGTRSASDGRQVTPIGQWRLSGARLIVEPTDAPALSVELNWATTSGARLQPRPAAQTGFFARRWIGDQTVTLYGMPGRFVDGLVAAERTCAGVTDPISTDPWWAGSLDLGSDGRYRANLRLVRYCSADGAALPVDSGHALVRLREGSWRVANAGRKLEFVETSGERLLVRLDALAAPQAGWAAICLDGALLGSATAPADVEGLLVPRSGAPVRDNLPLVLEEADGCLPARLKAPRGPMPASVELHADGLALADGLGEHDAQIAMWRIDEREITLRSLRGQTLDAASMRWQHLIGEPRLAGAADLIGIWSARSFQETGFYGQLAGVNNRYWQGEIEFTGGGRFVSTLAASTSPSNFTHERLPALLAHPLAGPLTGTWTLDTGRGEIRFSADNGRSFALRVSFETPGGTDTVDRVGTQAPRLQIDGAQFVRR
ncbi:MAG: hypothetical protein KAY46_18975 [Burkholderiaceae bacterium]|nr:hypothetical protein [Burkholderiaceae bacterium]